MKILLIDDEDSIRIGIGDDLRDDGHEVFDFGNPKGALEALDSVDPDCVLCDLNMPEMNGFEVLKHIRARDPTTIVIIITAYGNVESAVDCLKEGAFDYLNKPFQIDHVKSILEKAKSFVQLKHSNRLLQEALEERTSFHNLIGKSPSMQKVFQQIEAIAGTDGTVLIEGETGTGKELVAEAIHYHSHRRSGPLIKFSCAIFSRDILESELFGHEKGAFTGAVRDKRGRFELADKGTVFLDEIDDIPKEIQVKLLRFLQEKSFERVGGEKTLHSDVRIVVATKKNLEHLIEDGAFRMDLYYRLNVLPIRLPPLRTRSEDIPLLASHFLKKYAPSREWILTPEITQRLVEYDWPGNVRQLENVMERLAYINPGSELDATNLPLEIQNHRCVPGSEVGAHFPLSFEQTLGDFERSILQSSLKASDGNKKLAAKYLQLPYSTFRHKLDKFGLE